MSDDTTRPTRRQLLGGLALGGISLATAGTVSGKQKRKPATPSQDVTVIDDVTYATRSAGDFQTAGELKLDLYLPETDEPAPLVVFIHGGGWLVNTRKDSPDLEQYFAERGYAMATIDHRLTFVPDGVDPLLLDPDPNNPTPRGRFPDHIVDVKAAIRWLRAHADEYGIDPDNVATWGSSSGAHLAALAGTVGDVEEVEGDLYDITPTVAPDESGRVQAVVPWYPPTNFLKMDEQAGDQGVFPHDAPNSPESLLVGGPIQDNEDRVARADPITYVDANDPPFQFFHGRQDGIVAYEQSVILYEALRDACVDATRYDLLEFGHGFGFAELTQKPVPDQRIFETRGCQGGGPDDTEKRGPPAGPTVIEQFLDRTLRN
jgi:acetyl esterase/lipase